MLTCPKQTKEYDCEITGKACFSVEWRECRIYQEWLGKWLFEDWVAE